MTSADGGAWAKFEAIDSNGKVADPTTLPLGGMQMVWKGEKIPVPTTLSREAIFVQIPRVYDVPPVGATFEARYPPTIQALAPTVQGKLTAAAKPDPDSEFGREWLKSVAGQIVQVGPDTGRMDFKAKASLGGVVTIRPVGGLTIRSYDDGTRAVASAVNPDNLPEVWRFPYFQARFANAADSVKCRVTYLVQEPIDKVIELPPIPVNIHFGQPCAEPTEGAWFTPSPRIQIRLGNNPRIPKRAPRHTNRTVLIPLLVYGTYSHLKLDLQYGDIANVAYLLQLDGNYTAETAPGVQGTSQSPEISNMVLRGLKIHVTGTTYRAIASDTKEFKLDREIDPNLPNTGFRRG
jgi:hypothetical protein